RRATASSGVAIFRLDEFLNQLLGHEVLHDRGDAGMAEACQAGEGRARLRTVGAQGAQDEAPVQPPNAIAVADRTRQALVLLKSANHVAHPRSVLQPGL